MPTKAEKTLREIDLKAHAIVGITRAIMLMRNGDAEISPKIWKNLDKMLEEYDSLSNRFHEEIKE